MQKINTKIYWNQRFQDDWEENDGRKQTEYFVNLALDLIPEWLMKTINNNKLSVLDWGCALGDGTYLMDRFFEKSQVSGLDFSDAAIKKAKELYPNNNFLSGSLKEYNQKYDFIFSSNCLEHFEDPYYWLDELFDHANHFIGLLLPFQELDRLKEHFFTFDYDSFKLNHGNYYLIYHHEIQTNPHFWPGKQIFVIYANKKSSLFNDLSLEIYKESDIKETNKNSLEIRKIIAESSHLHKEIMHLHSQLITTSDWANNLKRELSDKDEIINKYKSDPESKANELSELKSTLEEVNSEIYKQRNTIISLENNILANKVLVDKKNEMIRDLDREKTSQTEKLNEILMQSSNLTKTVKELSDDLSHKSKEISYLHTELIKMSQWANSMKTRLDIIDKSRLLRAVEGYTTHGTKWLMKKAVNKILEYPKKTELSFVSQVNFSEVEKNVSSCKGVIIAFPVIDWNFRWQRPQHFLSLFASEGYTVLYIDMILKPLGRKYNSKEEIADGLRFVELTDNVYQFNLTTMNEMNIYKDEFQSEDIFNASARLHYVFEILKIKNPTYMVQFPGWNELVMQLKETFGGKVIFDCMDDHSGFNSNTSESIISEIQLIKSSDLVIASSDLLKKKVSSLNNNTLLLKNGTQFEFFNVTSPNGELDHIKSKPIIGYYGAISDWFDIELIEYLATQRPEWNFVLIGSTWGCDISRAEKFSNVHFLGEKNYNDLPGYLHYFDVCTIPFKLIPLTMATNPVKFYEYISCGKPVVSVDLPELRAYSKYCYLADDKSDFLEKVELALREENKELVDRRIDLAKENSWRSRFEILKQRVENL